MKIVGLSLHSGGVHDNSVALMEDGRMLFAEAEERLTRVKHDGRFAWKALREALKVSKSSVGGINYFVSANPEENSLSMAVLSLKFLPIVGGRNYLANIIKRLIYREDGIKVQNRPKDYKEAKLPAGKLIKVSHYLAHAAASYYSGPFDKCLVVAMDGFGLGEHGNPLSGQIFLGKNNRLELLEDVPIWGSLGFYYGAVTLALGFKLNDGEGKTMGLAAYGRWKKCYREMKNFFPAFKKKSWTIRPTIMDLLNIQRGKIWQESDTLNLLKSFVEKYGRENVAASCQKVFEEELLKYLEYLVRKYKIKKLNLVGGIFLNVKANLKILTEKVADEIFVYPNPTDGGTAVGAAILGFILKSTKPVERKELLHSAFGRSYTNVEILNELKKTRGISYKKIKNGLAKTVAKLLVDGQVVGWFQGRGEWGPRALGQRSVIADPRKVETKDRINNILKGREWFMPFAPSMMAEVAPKYLKRLRKAPFMIIADELKRGAEKDIVAAMHIDKTVRPHIVTRDANRLYYEVIKEFQKLTGVGVILNTSFNRHGLPIVYTPKDAIDHLRWKTIDSLVIGDYLVTNEK